ncbi:MAG: DUF2959 domain-containing protein [Wenzhouxiangellaceae bacterium]|nr:DUF2959 domain-containing protein [Wenzhouxiangellaceae bacterium]
MKDVTCLRIAAAAAVVVLALFAGGCQSVKYRALESVGIEKRDVLSSRVEAARDAQDDAREEFSSALEQFRATLDVDGGDLEKTYDRLNRAWQRSARQAEAVSDRVDAVENVAEDLFDEWEDELDLYSDADLRRRSERILDQTRQRYARMLTAMQRAEASMDPVLSVFRDQVLFLKHNLNSLAIASIRDEFASIERETEALIRAMDESIREADAFIATLES